MFKSKREDDIIAEVIEKIRLLYPRDLASSKRSAWCEKVSSLYDEWQQLTWELLDLSTMTIEEIATLESKISNLEQQIDLLLLDIHPYQHRDVFLEISILTGGHEGSIWVEDLVRMYTHYAVSRGWDVDIVSEMRNYPYGFSRSILEIKGAFVGYFLQFEAGIHQVKRRASTVYNSTKIHTSTATVTVMPMMQLGIHPSQLEWTTSPIYHPQRTNTIGVGLHHQPTGIRIVCDRCSSQSKNKQKASEIVQAVLFELNGYDLSGKINRQALSGEYPNSSIVRTYNYKKNCATGSISGMTFPLNQILEGNLDLSFAAHPNNPGII